jgi:hypothetical protein
MNELKIFTKSEFYDGAPGLLEACRYDFLCEGFCILGSGNTHKDAYDDWVSGVIEQWCAHVTKTLAAKNNQ